MAAATAAPRPVVVNGRFLAARQTGVQRAARQFLVHAREAGLSAEVWVPRGVHDPLADKALAALGGRAGAHLWEQVTLPVAAKERVVVSLANTAPVMAARGVVVVYDLAFTVCPRWFSPEMRLYGRITLAAARRARRVVTGSSQVADELARAGVAEDRIRVVRLAVDDEFVPAPSEAVTAARARFGLHRPYVLMVGWADPRKDVGTALAASSAVRPTRPHDLVLVGGAHRNFAKVPTPEDPAVKVIGYVDDDLLVPLLTGAAVLLYPSLYEGFGLPPLEAMACGTPALVSDLPAVVEATGGTAVALPVQDVGAWSSALDGALDGKLLPGTPPRWTWSQAGRAFRDVVDEVADDPSG